jgi:U3 small nucleolar RNA-associated protein 3
MGKKRNTAKTGDKGLYKARDTVTENARENDDDPMYNKVDRFHNERQDEFLKLDRGVEESEDDGEQEEGVMDLGIGGESSDESSDTSDDDDDDIRESKNAGEDQSEEELSSSEDEEDQMEMEDIRDWGKKKSAYYNGDTADLEIGQDAEDAYLEEEAAKEVQAARYADMNEDDFVLSDTEEDKKHDGDEIDEFTAVRDVTKLSLKDKRRLLDKQHPEYLPLLSYFSSVVKDLDTRIAVATDAVFAGDEGNAEVRLIYSSAMQALMID